MSGVIGSSPFVSRAEWGARPASTSTSITPQGNTGHYEGPGMGAYTHDRCNSIVRGIQAYHMDHNGWQDIAYTSLVCRHGFVYEGRWAGHRTAANGSNEGNQISYAHCVMIGDGDSFPDEAKRGLRDVVTFFEQHRSGMKLWPHKHWFNTACPGPEVGGYLDAGMPDVGGGPTPAPTPQPAPAPAPAPAPQEDSDLMANLPVLQQGSSGQAVKNLQGLLLAANRGPQGLVGGDGHPDGDFGPGTESALTGWQRDANVPGGPDGVCGQNTWRWLLGLH